MEARAGQAALKEGLDEETDQEASADPFIGSGEGLKISLPTRQDIADARLAAEQALLAGPQRITLADPAGPGSLADALARLEREGRANCTLEEDADGGPCLVYRLAEP